MVPLAEEPFGLAGDADGAGLSFPLAAAAAECENVNLKLPVCVRFGRFSLSSLSLTVTTGEERETWSAFSEKWSVFHIQQE